MQESIPSQDSANSTIPAKKPLPPWLRIRVRGESETREKVRDLLSNLRLNTVCAGAQCPNLCECFQHATATFLILGKNCTRNCKFCAVPHGTPETVEPDEPVRLAQAVQRLNLRYVVVTSVTRDDLPDGGAAHFAAVIRQLHALEFAPDVEVLTPDFKGDFSALQRVLEARPAVFNHNVETVERLSRNIRSEATYRRSLSVLEHAAQLENGEIPVKSGLMLGLGEQPEEIRQTLRDLLNAGVSIVTIGQYLPPSRTHYPLDRYVTPEEFAEHEAFARELGFPHVASSPLVRSSYHAAELLRSATGLKLQ